MPHRLRRYFRLSRFESYRSRNQSSFSQKKHVPQAIVKGTTARSPFFIFLLAAHLDDFAHRLMTENITAFHCRHVTIHQMQVRAADCGCGYLYE